jgi:hypothetical protein
LGLISQIKKQALQELDMVETHGIYYLKMFHGMVHCCFVDGSLMVSSSQGTWRHSIMIKVLGGKHL